MTLQSYQDEGKIRNWSSGMAFVPICDLNGKQTGRFGRNYTFNVVYRPDGAKNTLYIEFDAPTEKEAHKQAVEFINGLLTD